LTVDEIAAAYVDFVLYGLLAPSTAAGSAHLRDEPASAATPARRAEHKIQPSSAPRKGKRQR
jgi:hypothetical protein